MFSEDVVIGSIIVVLGGLALYVRFHRQVIDDQNLLTTSFAEPSRHRYVIQPTMHFH